MEIGSDGRATLYDIHAKKWIKVYPVDAREMLKLGTAVENERDVEEAISIDPKTVDIADVHSKQIAKDQQVTKAITGKNLGNSSYEVLNKAELKQLIIDRGLEMPIKQNENALRAYLTENDTEKDS